jgi:outer membrane autotransporter protein
MKFQFRHILLGGVAATALLMTGTQAFAAQVTVNNASGALTDTSISGAQPGSAGAGTDGAAAVNGTNNAYYLNGAALSTTVTGNGTTITGGAGGDATGPGLHNGASGVAAIYAAAATGGSITFTGGAGTLTINPGAGGAAVNGGAAGSSGTYAIDTTATAAALTFTLSSATVGEGSTGAINTGKSTTLNLTGGTNNNTISGLVTTTGGTVNFSGTNTITSTGATAFTLASGGAGATFNGMVNLGTTTATTISKNISIAGNGLTAANAAYLLSTVSSTQAASGQITNTAGTAAAVINNVFVTPTVSGVGTANGEKIVLIKGSTTGAITVTNVGFQTATGLVATSTTNTNAAGTYTVSATAYNTLVRTWSVADSASLGYSGTDKWGTALNGTTNSLVIKSTIATGAALTGVSGTRTGAFDAAANYMNNGTNTKFVALNQAIDNLNNTSDITKAVNQLRPEVNRASFDAGASQVQGALNTVAQRNNDVRLAQSGGTGVNSGEALKGFGAWVQGFGFYGTQGTVDGADGYNAKTGGVTIGADAKVADPVRVGLALTYGRTLVDAKGSNLGNKVTADAYQGTLYGSYTGSPWYVNGSAGFGLLKFDTTRLVGFTGFTDKNTGSHDGRQYTASADAGYPIGIHSAVLTPTVGMAWTRLDQDAYTEKSTSGSGLDVKSGSAWSLKSSLGGKVATTIAAGSFKVTPEARAAWAHEFHSDGIAIDAKYSNGDGTSFTTTGAKAASEAAIVGVGLTLLSDNNITVGATYDAELKTAYVGHNGSVKVRYDF